jgi:hypothetical protein
MIEHFRVSTLPCPVSILVITSPDLKNGMNQAGFDAILFDCLKRPIDNHRPYQ